MVKYLGLSILLISGIAFGQRSFYEINEVCEDDYDRQNIVIECYDVTNVSITRDYNNKYFAFFAGNQKTIIPFTSWYDLGSGIEYYYYNQLIAAVVFQNNSRVPWAIAVVDKKNNRGRRYVIKSWQQE